MRGGAGGPFPRRHGQGSRVTVKGFAMLGFFLGMFVTSIFLAMFAAVMLWRDSYYVPRHGDGDVYDWVEKGL